ncbi:hypothetical protein PR048_026876 [Dryococelus australis]|uniref:Uncharacterized protein n=1 Tax=Dryococelus australis TaxID=614101 RepID=A0ABQ9GMJ6_9NEOP|nr:hypothetical protein PR048_026876 [Dryococelus australis]
MSRMRSVKQLYSESSVLKPDPVKTFVIPHHAVLKEASSTTKICVVFDGSAMTSTGISLNELLLTRLKLQKDIGDSILNFRMMPVVSTTDICKMYRQIEIHPDDRYQDDVHVYQSNKVTYELASSPYQVLKTMQQLALDEAHQFPRASQVLLRDVVTGASSVEEAIQLKGELVSMLVRGGFEL